VKVLLSGAFNPSFEALPEYLAAAMRRQGHKVVLFDHRSFLIPGRLRRRLPILMRLDRARLNAAFLRRVRRTRPEVVVVNQGMTLTAATVRAAREAGARCVNWFSDYPAELHDGMLVAPAYDAFFLGSSYAARLHRDAGHGHASWLPFACDEETHRPIDAAGMRRVVLVGSYYPERHLLLRFLRGLPIDVYGPGWERAQDDPFVSPMLRGGAMRPERWRRLYGAAAAVLNIHYGSGAPRVISGDLENTRVFEILGCGALQIVDRQGDVMRLFREGVHLLAFTSGEELRARVEQALADPVAARAIARAGRQAVLAGHTYADRARVLIGDARSEFAVPESTPQAAYLRTAGGRS